MAHLEKYEKYENCNFWPKSRYLTWVIFSKNKWNQKMVLINFLKLMLEETIIKILNDHMENRNIFAF